MFTPQTCPISCVTCHMPRVTCHVSHATCHMSKNFINLIFLYFYLFIFFFRQSGEALHCTLWQICQLTLMLQILNIATFLILGRRSRSRGWIRVWLFSFMNPSMLVKTVGMTEGFVTHWTHKGIFSCVCSHMNNQMLRLRESLVTLDAGVLLLPHVSFYMSP